MNDFSGNVKFFYLSYLPSLKNKITCKLEGHESTLTDQIGIFDNSAG